MAEGTCSINGCERPRYCRGWCKNHYHRFLRSGEVGEAFEPRTRGNCSLDGCGSPHQARGLCGRHYKRVLKFGDPSVNRNDRPITTYTGMHSHLEIVRGYPGQFPCAHCEWQAEEWAYDHEDPEERWESRAGRDVPFSLDLDRYVPLCRSCHRRFDRRPPVT